MQNKRKILCVLGFLFAGLMATAQITIRDHRKDKVKWVPTIPPTRVLPVGQPDREVIPVTINNFRVDPSFRDEIRFKNNDWGILNNNFNQVYFSSKLVFENASLISLPASNKRDLLFFTDTLVIDGISELDLSRNSTNENGFLMISCRVLHVKRGHLSVNLGQPEFGKYRKFYLFLEQAFINGRRTGEALAIMKGFFVRKFNSGHWERLRVGETAPALPPGVQPRPGYKWVASEFNPFTASVGLLPTMIETNEWFYNFFSRWVVGSYQDLYGKILRDASGFDKMQAVNDFVKFVALNNYNQLESGAKAQSTQWIERIAPYKSEIFKNGFQFERTFMVDGRSVKAIGAVTENGITYYLPPAIMLVNATLVNQRSVWGFHVFDETQPNVSILDFDVALSTDTRLRAKLQADHLQFNETIGNGFEEMQFTNLAVSGPDIIPNQTKITHLSNNGFNIRLAVNNGSALVFNRLFSITSSDMFLLGKWGNRNSSIAGEIKLPVSFARQFAPPVSLAIGSVTNNAGIPAIIEFYMIDKYLMELSPALQAPPGTTATDTMAVPKRTVLTSDAVIFRLNPEKFGDYFEQIDNSDKLTQELFLENQIAPTAMDSTGYLKYAEVIVSYMLGDRKYQRKMQLSAANTLGSSYMLVVPKRSKDPVPLTISGRVYYENAEYDIVEMKLDNAEARFDLQERMLKNK